MKEQPEVDYIIPNPVKEVSVKDFKGAIKFENVWFAYNGSDYVLKGVSFQSHLPIRRIGRCDWQWKDIDCKCTDTTL